MKTIRIQAKNTTRFKKGFPLLQLKDLRDEDLGEKGIIRFTDQQDHFIAYGYLAHQNKGEGWLMSWQEDEKIDQHFFEEKFAEAKEKRQSFWLDEQTNAFRILNGEGDGLGGVTVDWYAGYAVFSWYNAGLFALQNQVYAGFLATYPECKGVYQKIRFHHERQDLLASSHISGEAAPEPLLIRENGLNYATYLNEGMMTGIFLDQREVRQSLTENYAVGQTVLNTFSYTGAFSVACAMGGAIQTTSVDLANRSKEKTQEQFTINGLDLDAQKIYVMDVFDYFNYAQRKSLSYDIVVLDPPSFARNKKKTFQVTKDYERLLFEALQVTAENGLIVASTNAANMSMNQFEEQIDAAFEQADRDYEVVETHQLPADFALNENYEPGNYLKVLFLRCD